MKRVAWFTLMLLVIVMVGNCGDDGGTKPDGTCGDEYKQFAQQHYSRDRFWSYVRDTVVVLSGHDDFMCCTDPGTYDSACCWAKIKLLFPLTEQDDDVFYQRIGDDDRYVFGWKDWNPYAVAHHEDCWVGWDPFGELPACIPTASAFRDSFLRLRECSS
jgi:hypothetical protein